MLALNIVHFARVLQAITAVETVGLDRRGDVHAALSAVMLDRHEQQAIFDAAFETFWRDPKLMEQLMLLRLPKVSGRGTRSTPQRGHRLEEALAPPRQSTTCSSASCSATSGSRWRRQRVMLVRRVPKVSTCTCGCRCASACT